MLTSIAFRTWRTAPSTDIPKIRLLSLCTTTFGGADVCVMYVSSMDSLSGVGGGASSEKTRDIIMTVLTN